MFAGDRLFITLGQAKVDKVDNGRFFAVPNTHILRLQVSVDKVLLVHRLHSHHQLAPDPQHGLHREFLLAKVEQLFERRTQQLHHQNEEFTLDSGPVQLAESRVALELFEQLGLVLQHWRLAGEVLHLNGNMFVRLQVHALIDAAERF